MFWDYGIWAASPPLVLLTRATARSASTLTLIVITKSERRLRAPLFEPGLDDLISRKLAQGKLTFSSDPADAAGCELVWITLDTPVDDHDVADTSVVRNAVERLFPYLKDDAVLLISSQLPVGSTRAMAQTFTAAFPGRICHFAYSP